MAGNECRYALLFLTPPLDPLRFFILSQTFVGMSLKFTPGASVWPTAVITESLRYKPAWLRRHFDRSHFEKRKSLPYRGTHTEIPSQTH